MPETCRYGSALLYSFAIEQDDDGIAFTFYIITLRHSDTSRNFASFTILSSRRGGNDGEEQQRRNGKKDEKITRGITGGEGPKKGMKKEKRKTKTVHR